MAKEMREGAARQQDGGPVGLSRRQALALAGAALALPAQVAFGEELAGETEVQEIDEGLESWRYEDGAVLESPRTDGAGLSTLASYEYPTWENSYGTSCYGLVDSSGNVTTVPVSGVESVGIDVSRWQGGSIDWSEVAGDGITFAIIRCMGHVSKLSSVPSGYSYWASVSDSGYYYAEPYFERNVTGALAAGIKIGVYVYSLATSTAGAAQEASLAMDQLEAVGLGPEDLEMPVFLDMEDSSTTSVGTAMLGQIAQTFCDAFDAAGYQVGIYANKNWWTNYLTDSAFDNGGWMRWAARYSLSTSITSCGVDEASIWQFTSHGSVSGISGYADVNFGYFAASYSADFIELSGATRYETMAAIVAEAYGGEQCECAVVASGENFPDALAASSLAGALDAPVVLTKAGSAAEAIEVLESLGAGTVYVVGGPSAVSDSVVSSIAAAVSGTVERVYGDTRQLTAIAIADKVRELVGGQPSDTAIVAAGANFPDALAASPYSYWSHSPIYLADSDGSISDETLAAISEGGFSRIVVMGGSSAIPTEAFNDLCALDVGTVDRVYGEDRYETAAAMARWCIDQGMEVDNAAVATGANFPDALAGAALCGRKGSVLLLATKNNSEAKELLKDYASSVSTLYFLGGTSAISRATRLNIMSVFAE